MRRLGRRRELAEFKFAAIGRWAPSRTGAAADRPAPRSARRSRSRASRSWPRMGTRTPLGALRCALSSRTGCSGSGTCRVRTWRPTSHVPRTCSARTGSVGLDNDLALVAGTRPPGPGYFVDNVDAARALRELLDEGLLTPATWRHPCSAWSSITSRPDGATDLLAEVVGLVRFPDHGRLAELLTRTDARSPGS